MSPRRFNLTFGAIWLGWIVGLAPVIALLLPIARSGDAGEFAFVAALLAYFAAPFLLIAYLD